MSEMPVPRSGTLCTLCHFHMRFAKLPSTLTHTKMANARLDAMSVPCARQSDFDSLPIQETDTDMSSECADQTINLDAFNRFLIYSTILTEQVA